jgi:hypothetical protein
VAFFPHEVDHVIAEKHGGTTVPAGQAGQVIISNAPHDR